MRIGDTVFTQASDAQWEEYTALAARSFGHEVRDTILLSDVADRRVAIQNDKVIAGGWGLLTSQYFGGSAVSTGLLGAGSVAPEARGERLAVDLVKSRVRALREGGAVISAIWTSSNAYGRAMGWEAPCHVNSWQIRTDDLRRSFDSGEFSASYGRTASGEKLQDDFAKKWNGGIQRPTWWSEWKRNKSKLDEYQFSDSSGRVRGLVSMATSRDKRYGMSLVVHDFIPADSEAASAMFSFLSRNNSRAEFVDFRRGCLSPAPFLLHNLHRFRANGSAWHPWMLRILDVPGAIAQRGWGDQIDSKLCLEVFGDGGRADRYLVSVSDGIGLAEQTNVEPDVRVSQQQLAVWFAGGIRSVESARFFGVDAASESSMREFLLLTSDREPWLSDLF